MKSKKFNVTNASHSFLVEPLIGDLERVGQGLTFKEPLVLFARATEFETKNKQTPRFVADHMRNPVYFKHGIQRLSQRHLSCTWLEAGSTSAITMMAGRVLGPALEMVKSTEHSRISRDTGPISDNLVGK